MKNDNLKKNGQFQNVWVEYDFGAVWKGKHSPTYSDDKMNIKHQNLPQLPHGNTLNIKELL